MPNSLTSLPANSQDLSSARSSEAVQTLRAAQAQDPKKIDKAARNFESLLVGHWLEQAEKSFATVPGTDPDQQDDSSRDQFMSIACQSLAQGLSRLLQDEPFRRKLGECGAAMVRCENEFDAFRDALDQILCDVACGRL